MRSGFDAAVILLISDGLVAAGRVLGGLRRRCDTERRADALAVAEESRECWEADELWAAAEYTRIPEPYLPLTGEKRCASCNRYRGEHIDAHTANPGCPGEITAFSPLEGSSKFEQWTSQRSAAVTVPAADNTTQADHLEAAWNYHRPQANYNGNLVWGCEGCNWGGPTIQAHSRHRFHVLADMKAATTRVQEQLGGTA